ncbi:MaoC family dehydratase [Zavarzinia compransoris]|uniref:Dehydratase n=1 Tax=Zavarzinia compransoris TaxID=1264899 RepID=A0A317DXM6_9PROT|nr:MaoC family dehydratase [Zavarzinia compransoris]PWR17713.1 dehydratase [Zavarzinia compransoris]TDP49236.1 acyl dehydratase [Zavarzinia compransoris]
MAETTKLAGPRDFIGREGTALGTSDWLLVEQGRIDLFADATNDHQWIHVDAEKAKTGPFGATIAHGYLTLSLISGFLPQIVDVGQFKMGVNIGCDKIRFLNPVTVGSRIRGKGELAKVQETPDGGIQVTIRVTVEIDGSDKPACVADTVSRFYP